MNITADRIMRAADELLAENGLPPTIRQVRDRLGRGSMSTITSAMSVWRDEQEQLALVPAPVVAACMKAAGKIWREAQARMGGEEVGAVDSSFIEELEAQLARVRAKVQELETESEERRTMIHRLHHSITSANRRAEEAEKKAIAADARNEALHQVIETLRK